MPDDSPVTEAAGAAPPMTPERWRAVDAVLRGALACEPDRRHAFVLDACGGDETLRREVVSLLAAHDAMSADFLERPAVEALGASPAPAPNEPAGEALAVALAGRYTIESEIARGGMATVYRARDLRHGRSVAIKVMRDEIAAAVGAERFLEEIRVTALLQHPHILPLFDSGSAGRLLWYVMPLVEGETLRSRLAREGRVPVEEAVRIATEVADALEHAHAREIVHRDIKPENVLLQGGHALVADFGIALAIEHAGGERLTRTGLTLGTPQYMAPEQAAGERALDARVDVYSLAATLYEMLAGEPPFAAESRQAVVQRMLNDPPAPLTARRPDVSAALDAAVQRALAKRPNERFATASAFAAALVESAHRVEPAPIASPGGLSGDRRPAAVSPPTAGMVPTRVVMYAAAAGLMVGVLAGWGLAHSPMAARWRGDAPPQLRSARQAPTVVRANLAGPVGADARTPWADGSSLVVVNRAGELQRTIDANRPWTPRFSPDGRRVAYGAFGAGRGTSDIWITDLATGKTQRLTDDDADSNDPQWSPDGSAVAYSVSAPGGKDVAVRRLPDGAARVLASRDGTQFPSDWLRDGSALIVTDQTGPNGSDVVVQPSDGSAARRYVATAADETAGRVSPDGHWIAYTSSDSGRAEVYLDSYPRPRRRVMISQGGGIHPVWRADGRELYYWRDGALVAVQLGATVGDAPPAIRSESVLFRAPYQSGLNTMYDVSPDGERFVFVQAR
jgi:tRNA A-37 threonylcarbamoyl transferase component Bud32